MKRFSQQFKKQSESIRLKASEKSALRERIVSYMEYHPLPQEMRQAELNIKTQKEFIVSEPFRVVSLNKFYFRSFAGIFALFLFVGVPFIAEHTLPGDVLYPVKIQFNEELRSSLAISPYAKVAWETERLERRISEARLLASEGKLTSETETQVAEAVKTHSDAAQREIDTLRQSDSDGAAIAEITLASALAVQSEVLAGHADKDTQNGIASTQGDGRSVAALAQVVDQARDSAQAAQTTSSPSYEKLLARVESESTHAYELFASVKKGASAEEVANVERRLADIQRKVDVARGYYGLASSSDHAIIPSEVIDVTTAVATDTATGSVTSVAVQDVATDTITTTVATNTDSVAVDEDQSASTSDGFVPAASQRDAIDLLRGALTDIQKLQSYLTHIDVRNNVSINDLVPITLTADEQIAQITDLFTKTQDVKAEVASRTLTNDVKAKVTIGQSALTLKLKEVEAALKKGDLDTAYVAVQNAYLMASDLDKLTGSSSSNILLDSNQTQSNSTSTDEAE